MWTNPTVVSLMEDFRRRKAQGEKLTAESLRQDIIRLTGFEPKLSTVQQHLNGRRGCRALRADPKVEKSAHLRETTGPLNGKQLVSAQTTTVCRNQSATMEVASLPNAAQAPPSQTSIRLVDYTRLCRNFV